jgi:nucleoside-diphosphate-sugar epimerase
VIFSIHDRDLKHITQEAQTAWQDLDAARIFITGGTGFFGVWLLESLLFAKLQHNLQTEIVVLSRNPAAFLQKFPALQTMRDLTWVQGGIQNFVFPEGAFTHVIHAATPASADLNQNQPLLMLDTIIEGTRRVLDFAVQSGAKKFLLTSSGAIYGTQPPDLSHIDESHLGMADPLQSTSAYGGGKWVAEHLTNTYAKQYGFEAKIARCFAFVGPYLPLDTHFAIGNFMQNVLLQQPIHLHGDGTPYRSYLYAADLMIWLWQILCGGENGRAYNVGSEQAVALSDLAHAIAESATPQLPVVIAKQADPTMLPARYIPSTQRAQRELALKQWINLEDSIQRTLNWWTTCKN